MRVGDPSMIVEIGGMQRYLIDNKMTGGILTEVHTEIDTKGTMLTKEYRFILGVSFIRGSEIPLDFDKKSVVIPDSKIEDLPIAEGNLEIDLSKTELIVVADILSRKPVESMVGENNACAVIDIWYFRPESN
ncbi:hypothetical protein TNCV_4371651 [Trichonephila clavipes]|nr:hypothetical protein TNCV_4371651 [Trichonephila clavipes]